MKNMLKQNILIVVLLAVFIGLILSGCKKKENQDSEQSSAIELSSEENQYDIENINFENTENDSINIDIVRNTNLSFTAPAHSKYLNDPLKFHELPDGGIPSGATAVVGSDVCRFYPVESISTNADLARLPQGELIPFTTIIPLGEKLSYNNSGEGWFSFQDNENYFYKTRWNGKNGIVFGADLYGIGVSNHGNRINSLLYKYNGQLENFYSAVGNDQITQAIMNDLESTGIAFQSVKPVEYKLSLNNPDDMISLYNEYTYDTKTTVFVTTDLAAHANHLIFSRMLQYVEETYFFPQLVILVDEYIKAIEQRKSQIPESVYNASLLYFQTAKALLALTPDKIIGQDYYGTVQYQDVDAAGILREFPRQVIAEIEKMNNASGIEDSSVYPFMKEDYSQYKVRGHYTKNGVLGAYFRALIWFGRINFNLGGDNETARKSAIQMTPIALFITDITENSPNIKKIWHSLFDPITEFIGVSDDISFVELSPLWNRIKGAGYNQWYSDPAKLERFVSVEYKELRPPSISGFSLIEGPYAGGDDIQDRKPPVGWRLFGQRYTLDSEIHHNVSPPRYFNREAPRDMVSGLDIMKVFGSAAADGFLRQSDYIKHQGLEEVLNSMQKDIGNLNDDYWFSTYYTNNLYQIKTLATFESGTGFYFTEKPGWNLKAMNSAHGTWAELRHDTILYVKQSYAETGGGTSEATFRTKPIPEAVHYIEPNIPFWNTCVTAFQKLSDILKKYGILDNSTASLLTGMQQLYVKAAEISKLEAEDREVPKSDITWIRRLASELTYRVMTHASGGTIDDVNTLRMALVADVYTNAEVRLVLETAVGIPYRLYIPLNDRQGGKRIAIGYGFSYYEFHQPMSERLNNEEWKAIVYSDNPDMSEYLPFWMQGKVQPPK